MKSRVRSVGITAGVDSRRVLAGVHLCRERQRGGGDIGRELPHARRADDCRGHERAAHAEGQRHLRGVEPVLAGQRHIGGHHRRRGRAPASEERRVDGGARPRRHDPVLVFAGEKPGGQRGIGHQPHMLVVAHLGQVEVEDAVQEAVFVLDRHDPGQAVAAREFEACGEAEGAFVRQPHVPHLAPGDEPGERRENLMEFIGLAFRLPGRIEGPAAAEMVGAAVGPVELVEVDMVGLQALEAAVEGGAQGGGADRRAIGTHVPVAGAGDLAGEDDLAAAAGPLQPGTDDALGVAGGLRGARRRGVELRGVDEIHPVIERVVDLGKGLLGSVLAAPGHGAEAEAADLEIARSEEGPLHGRSEFRERRLARGAFGIKPDSAARGPCTIHARGRARGMHRPCEGPTGRPAGRERP